MRVSTIDSEEQSWACIFSTVLEEDRDPGFRGKIELGPRAIEQKVTGVQDLGVRRG
jgi:hypothetical protein